MNRIEIIIFISAISFIVYSSMSIFSKKMILEYKRWGYQRLRILIALFQLLGGIGLLLGMFHPLLLMLVSFLLMIMMIFAIIVRIKIRDTIVNTLPAIIYALLTFNIFLITLLNINSFV